MAHGALAWLQRQGGIARPSQDCTQFTEDLKAESRSCLQNGLSLHRTWDYHGNHHQHCEQVRRPSE